MSALALNFKRRFSHFDLLGMGFAVGAFIGHSYWLCAASLIATGVVSVLGERATEAS